MSGEHIFLCAVKRALGFPGCSETRQGIKNVVAFLVRQVYITKTVCCHFNSSRSSSFFSRCWEDKRSEFQKNFCWFVSFFLFEEGSPLSRTRSPVRLGINHCSRLRIWCKSLKVLKAVAAADKRTTRSTIRHTAYSCVPILVATQHSSTYFGPDSQTNCSLHPLAPSWSQ